MLIFSSYKKIKIIQKGRERSQGPPVPSLAWIKPLSIGGCLSIFFWCTGNCVYVRILS